MSTFNDSLQNLVSGMGTDRDKQSGTTYEQPSVETQQYKNAFRGAWLPRRVVSQVAEDCFRKWRNWQAEPTQISKIEALEKRLDVRAKMERALIMARLLGRSYVYISIKGDEDRTAEPLNPDRVRRDALKELIVWPEYMVAEGMLGDDPMSADYGLPQYYEVTGGTRIHPTRMVTLYGAERPQDRVFGRDADSVLTATLPAIKRHDSTVANVAGLVFEARVDVISIPGLADLLQDADTEEALLKRFALMSQMKGNNGLVMLNGATTPNDPTETWEQKNSTFATLPDIIEKAQEEVAAAARIPRAILFGTGAGGLGATGDLELSSYYDHINTLQTNSIEPAMAILDEVLIRAALGNRPDEIWYEWASLWQQSDKERAELANSMAGAIEKIVKSGTVPAEVMTESVVNMLTENGVFPGLEANYNEWLAGGDDQEDMIEEIE